MTDCKIPRANLIEFTEIAKRELRRFNHGNDGIQYYLYARMITGLCGEYGFRVWAEENRLLPKQNKIYTNDFFIGSDNIPVEVKTFKALTLEKFLPCVSANALNRIKHHSNIIVFGKVNIQRVSYDPDVMAKMYSQGINFNVLGYLLVHEVSNVGILKNDKDEQKYYIPFRHMRSKEELVMTYAKKNNRNIQLDKWKHNTKNKFIRIGKGKDKVRKFK